MTDINENYCSDGHFFIIVIVYAWFPKGQNLTLGNSWGRTFQNPRDNQHRQESRPVVLIVCTVAQVMRQDAILFW